jgi:hypothetical protein
MTAKKQYATPSLSIYGNLTSLTNSVGMSGKSDGGGSKSSNKTS